MSACENCVREYVWNGGDNPIPGECKDCQVGLDGKPTHYQRKPQTNADRIRAMSDEELAKHFSGLICDINEGVEYHENPNTWLEWLKQPAEVDNG